MGYGVVLRGKKCRCGACGMLFGTVSAFDSHRVGKYRVPGDRRCLNVIQMADKGFKKDSRGFWRHPSRLLPMSISA